jgi:hypothetical protein
VLRARPYLTPRAALLGCTAQAFAKGLMTYGMMRAEKKADTAAPAAVTAA